MGDQTLFSPSVPNQGTVWISSGSLAVGQTIPLPITPKNVATLPVLKDVGCITTRFPNNSGIISVPRSFSGQPNAVS